MEDLPAPALGPAGAMGLRGEDLRGGKTGRGQWGRRGRVGSQEQGWRQGHVAQLLEFFVFLQF